METGTPTGPITDTVQCWILRDNTGALVLPDEDSVQSRDCGRFFLDAEFTPGERISDDSATDEETFPVSSSAAVNIFTEVVRPAYEEEQAGGDGSDTDEDLPTCPFPQGLLIEDCPGGDQDGDGDFGDFGDGDPGSDDTGDDETPTPLPEDITARGTANGPTFEGNLAEYGPPHAIDGDETTSWFSPGPNSQGETELVWIAERDEFGVAREFRITEVRIVGNANHFNPTFRTDFGLGSVGVELLDAQDQVVAQQFGSGLGAVFQFDEDATRIRLTFSGHQSADCGGFAELIVEGY